MGKNLLAFYREKVKTSWKIAFFSCSVTIEVRPKG